MTKPEKEAMEKAWRRFARSVNLPTTGHAASTERGCFEAGWIAALRHKPSGRT